MKNFRKLKRCGSIVFILDIEKNKKVIQGCNLNSPGLKIKSYSEDKFDQDWDGKTAEFKKVYVIMAFKSIGLSSHVLYESMQRIIFPEKFPVASPYSDLSKSTKKT